MCVFSEWTPMASDILFSINNQSSLYWLRLPEAGAGSPEQPQTNLNIFWTRLQMFLIFSLTLPEFIVEYLIFSYILSWSWSWPSCGSLWGSLWIVKTIWSNDQARPGLGHGDNHHHSQKQQNQQCIQHCSHVQSHYQSTLSQIITNCYCSTTSLDRTR